MSLIKKLKAMLNNPGCVRETSKFICPSEMDKVLKVLEAMGPETVGEGNVKIREILKQTIYWIEKLEKDIDIIKGDTLRNILSDIASIKMQLIVMGQEAHDLRSHKCEDYKYLPDTQFMAKAKDTLKKMKKTKEINNDNE